MTLTFTNKKLSYAEKKTVRQVYIWL